MHDSGTNKWDMISEERTREVAILELEHLLASAVQLRSLMRSTEGRYRRVLKILRQGTVVSKALDDVHAGAARLALTEALASFELRRHRSRLALIAAGLAEGMTIGELSRAWGFSRQLGSRYAKEARGQLEVAGSASGH